MALIKCKNCGKQISDKANACIHCGSSILKDDTINNKNQMQNKENELLRKELEAEKIKSSNLQEKLNDKKKEQIDNVIKTSKKMTTKILNFIRYFLAIFCCIGGLACLTKGQIFDTIAYIIIGISFIPFLYKPFKKNKKLATNIQIIVPIIAFVIACMLFSIGR